MKVLGMTDALTLPISFSTFPSRFSHQQRATLCFQIARPWQFYCSPNDSSRFSHPLSAFKSQDNSVSPRKLVESTSYADTRVDETHARLLYLCMNTISANKILQHLAATLSKKRVVSCPSSTKYRRTGSSRRVKPMRVMTRRDLWLPRPQRPAR